MYVSPRYRVLPYELHTIDDFHTAGAKSPPPEITVTVKQAEKPELTFTAPPGANLRDAQCVCVFVVLLSHMAAVSDPTEADK